MTLSPHSILQPAKPLGWVPSGARFLLPARPAFFIQIRRHKTPAKGARPQAAAPSGTARVSGPRAVIGGCHG